MLSAVSGGEVIQDVPACFAGNILDDNYAFISDIFIVDYGARDVCFMDCECGSVQAVKEHGNR